ncbi:MAG: rhomboid family intramembrane serine protease [Phycisphaerales bacterium]
MIIPLGTDRPLTRPTVVNHALIAVNLAVFLAAQLLVRFSPESWQRIEHALILDPTATRWWQPVSYAFLHAGFWHIFGNLLTLWVFGPNVEDRFGRLGYLLFYLASAIAAGLLHAAFYPNPVLGASGAIAGVTGAYLVLFPRTIIHAIFLLFLAGTISIPAWWFVGGRIAWDLLAQGTGRSGSVATLAHLGGYAMGIAVSLALLGTRVLSREPYDLFTISKQAARRRQFKEASFQSRKRAAEAQASAAKEPIATDAVALARADVSAFLSADDIPASLAAYRTLLDKHGKAHAILSRRLQYDIANHFFAAEDFQNAATAYTIFLAAYPTDPERYVVELMLGLIAARYLNDPVEAKQRLKSAVVGLPESDHLNLAKELLAEIG